MRNGVFVNGADGTESGPQRLGAVIILGAVANTVFGHQFYKDTVSATSRDAVARMAARAQEQTTQQAYQGTLNQLNAWSQVVCNVGQKLAGKTIDKILVAFDRPGGKGQFRGYIDDITSIN